MFNPPSRQDSAMRPYKGRPRANVPIAFARVVLDEQRTYVYNARKRLIATLPSSTGLWDSTPPGYFRVFSKSAQTYYTPNPGERMKWMVRFTKGRQGGNIGFHGIPYTVKDGKEIPFPTPLGEKPASHGCVRLANQDAEWLFRNMSVGATVTVVRSRG
jgi:lipoprotein-anchoring transpeptidase ErfK/SrfK